MSARNTVHFTARSNELPAEASTVLMFSSAWRVWPAIPVSASSRVPGLLPIWPERYSMFPTRTAIENGSPRTSPGPWSTWRSWAPRERARSDEKTSRDANDSRAVFLSAPVVRGRGSSRDSALHERPHDHERDPPDRAREKRRARPVRLEYRPERQAPDQRGEPGDPMVHPEPAPLPRARESRYERAFRALGESRDEPHPEKQAPRRRRRARPRHARRQCRVHEPAGPHRPRRSQPVGRTAAEEARRRAHHMHRRPQQRHHRHRHAELLRAQDDQRVGHAEEIEKRDREERRHTCGLVEVGGGWWRLVKVTSTLLHHPPPSSTILYCPHREHQHEHPRRNARPDDRPQPRRP